MLEQWFSEYPEDGKRELHKRFTNRKDDGQHDGAWRELYIASLFRHRGYEVVPHPTIEGSKRKPDFLVTREESAFYHRGVKPCAPTGSISRLVSRELRLAPGMLVEHRGDDIHQFG